MHPRERERRRAFARGQRELFPHRLWAQVLAALLIGVLIAGGTALFLLWELS